MQKTQGWFTSDGTNKLLDIPNAVDIMRVYNFTEAGATNDDAVEFYWQRGMAAGAGIYYYKSGGGNGLSAGTNSLTGEPGFKLVNSADQTVGNAVSVTSTVNQAGFQVNANVDTLQKGDIVRLNKVDDATNLNGFDFEIDNIQAGSFDARWDLANAPGATGGSEGFYRKVDFDPIFYPRGRYIVNITQASSAVVRTSVTHGYVVGQTVRLYIPSVFGMVEANDKLATITAVDTANNTFTLDLDTLAMTAFVWPAAGDLNDFAYVSPSKFDTAEAISQGASLTANATENQAVRGMLLYAGGKSPAGEENDVIFWEATSSLLIRNP